MFAHLSSNPLWSLFFEDKVKNAFYAFAMLSLGFLAALLEGASFTCIYASFSFLSGGTPSFINNSMKEFIHAYNHVVLFSIFLFAAVFAQILRSLFAYLGQLGTALLTVNLQTLAQKRIYHRIFYLTFSSIHRYKLGDLIHYATAPPTYFRYVMDSLNRIVVAIMMIAVYIIIMMKVSISLTGSVLVLFCFSALMQKTLLNKIIGASQVQSSHIVDLNQETAQNLSGIRAVHLFGRREEILKKIEKTLKELGKASLNLNKWNQLITPLNEAIGVLLVAVMTGMSLYIFRDEGTAVFPILLTFLVLTYRFAMRLVIIMNGWGEIASNIGPINRLQEILFNQDKEFLDLSDKPEVFFKNTIEFNKVSLKYPEKNIYAVQDISFNIQKGKIIAFVGSSGCGKSTLTDLLLRLYEPTEGKICVDERPIVEFSLSSWRELFGAVSQEVFLFHDTIEYNIRFGNLNASYEEIEEAAKLAGAHNFIRNLPQDYQTIVGEKGYKLSGGERQRISLARALVKKPEILVLDEATSNLDSQSEQIIQETLEKLRGKTTILVVAHRLATINMADQIILLEKGKIVEQGTHVDLIKMEGRYHNFWSLQSSLKKELELSPLS